MDFIYNLYQNDNFIIYLSIILVVLVILFVVVFFFGKKDQKLEETKKLQKIDLDNAFKEEHKEAEKVEINTELEEKKEEIKEEKIEDNNELPKENVVEKKSIFDETQSLPVVNEEEVDVVTFEPTIKEDNEDLPLVKDEDFPLLSENKEEEEKPLFVQDVDDIEKDLNELASLKRQIDDVGLNTDIKAEEKEKVKSADEKKFKPSPVFSSVFVSKPEEMKEDSNDKKVPLFTIEDDVDMELPALKKDTADEQVKLDDITGETYEIKR